MLTSNAQRMLDLLGVALVAPVALPAATAAACAIRALDGGPVLFFQERIGRDRQPFVLAKLRTMRDGQVTPVGRVLRKSGLDELPQLVHVLRGEMSLVGPRPLTFRDVVRLGWDVPQADARFSVLPGITGPTQLSATCNAQAALERDLAYARSRSVTGDIALLIRSALVPILGRSIDKELAR